MNVRIGFAVVLVLLVPGSLSAAGPGLEGTWKFVPGRSTDIASWNYSQPQIDISSAGANVRIVHNWLDRGKTAYADTFAFRPGGETSSSVVCSEVWPENWYMGVLSSAGETRRISGLWLQPGKSLRVITRESLRTSQGTTPVTTTREYTFGPDGTLSLTEKRSSRPTPVVLVFERKEPPR